MLETEFGAKFQKWWNLKDNGEYINRFCDQAAFEYKVTKGGTFNLNTWRKKEPQQETELIKATNKDGVLWKISDTDPRSKPFDSFFLSSSPAFLVIWFEKYKSFFIINVLEIPNETSLSFKYCLNRWENHKFNNLKKRYYDID